MTHHFTLTIAEAAQNRERQARLARLGFPQTQPLRFVRTDIKAKRKPIAQMVADPSIAMSTMTVPTVNRPHSSRVREIKAQVCDKHGLRGVDIMRTSRDYTTVAARHELCYRLRTETTLTYPQIARHVGMLNHTSALYAVRKHAVRIMLPATEDLREEVVAHG